MEIIGDHRIRDRRRRVIRSILMQVICAGDTDVPRTEITRVEVVAGAEVDARLLDPTEISNRAIIDPKYGREGTRGHRVLRVVKETGDHCLEFGTAGWRVVV